MQSYVESVRQNIAGQGKVLELGSVNGTGFSVNSMHSTSSTAAAHGVHNSNNSTAHGVHNNINSTAAAPSVHSSGYHSSTSSQGLWFLSFIENNGVINIHFLYEENGRENLLLCEVLNEMISILQYFSSKLSSKNVLIMLLLKEM